MAFALALQAMLFGYTHAYQGASGMVSTGLFGLALGALYVRTRSLWAPIAVPAFYDVYGLLMIYFGLNSPW